MTNADAAALTPRDLEAMIEHWLQTPAGSYYGSSYGSNIKNTLQRPMQDREADEVIRKMTEDIPILQMLPAGSVNLYSYVDPDKVDVSHIVIQVAGLSIEVPRG